MAGHTVGRNIMLACTVKPSPVMCPASAIANSPVCAATRGVDHSDLPYRIHRIACDQTGQSIRCTPAGAHQIEAELPVGRVRHRLCRYRTNPGLGPGHDRSD
jgi:hypothetical protein